MSTVDPLQAALGGDMPEPSGAGDGGNSNGAADDADHPILNRFGGDVRKALDAYQQLDREYGQQGDRLGKQVAELQTQLAELQAQRLEGDPTQQVDDQNWSMPDMPMDQLQAWFEQDPAQATAYLITQGQQMQLDQINKMIDSRLQPLEVNVGRTTASTLVESLQKALGNDVVARNTEALVALQKSDPAFFQGDPQVVFQRMKTAVLAADYEKGNQRGAAQQGAASDVQVLGGSQGRNPAADVSDTDPAEAFKKELLGSGTAERDLFGNPKRRPAA